jgi:ubiquinone/menaquinone biosynthesis C-methylase UbiE
MRGLAIAGLVGSAAVVGIGVMVGRDRLAAAQANIRRYSMPGPRSYDVIAHLLFDDRYRAIATAIAAEVPAGSKLLDVGCGPGEVLVRLASIAPAIVTTGADIDPAMIERARRKADLVLTRGATGAPSFVVADASSLPFPDASFDVVVSSFSVHHWTDRRAGLAEAMRVLRPGGRAIVWDIAPPHPAEDEPTPSAHGTTHGHNVHNAPAAAGGHASPPEPSLLATLRMVVGFRRLPSQRYDFTKPGA